MPLKKTTPRSGSKPLAYFKGTTAETNALTSKQIQTALWHSGVRFETKTQRTAEIKGLRKKIRKFLYKGKRPQVNKPSPHNLYALVEEMNLEKGIHKLTTKKGIIGLKIRKTKQGTILITPMALLHGITGGQKNPFSDLLAILEKEFVGGESWGDKNNVIWQDGKKRKRIGIMTGPEYKMPSINGDVYSIEIMGPVQPGLFIPKAKPTQILSVNVRLAKGLAKAEQEARVKFYREQIKNPFGIPVKFIN